MKEQKEHEGTPGKAEADFDGQKDIPAGCHQVCRERIVQRTRGWARMRPVTAVTGCRRQVSLDGHQLPGGVTAATLSGCRGGRVCRIRRLDQDASGHGTG